MDDRARTDVEQRHSDAVESLVASPGRIFVVGGVDSGKTTFCRRVVQAGLAAGHLVAVVDADLGQSSIGPPTTVAMSLFREEADLSPENWARPDALSFVGEISPRGHFLPLVVGTAKLVMRAIEMGARLIVIDTSGLIAGVAGQTLKLAKAELARPHHVVALAHGGELEPVTGVLRRFLSLEAIELPIHPDIRMRSVDERASSREERLAAFLGPELHRWRVKPTAFMPALPPGFDPGALDGVLVGVDDGSGECLGLGILECRDDALRLLTPVSEGVRALRLGSVRVTPEGKIAGRIDVRSTFGTD